MLWHAATFDRVFIIHQNRMWAFCQTRIDASYEKDLYEFSFTFNSSYAYGECYCVCASSIQSQKERVLHIHNPIHRQLLLIGNRGYFCYASCIDYCHSGVCNADYWFWMVIYSIILFEFYSWFFFLLTKCVRLYFYKLWK